MRFTQFWQHVTYISGGIVVTITAIRLSYTKVVRPMFRGTNRARQRADKMVDLFLGDAAKGLPSLPDQVQALREEQARQAGVLAEHVGMYHAPLRQSNGNPAPQRSTHRTR